MKRKAAIAAIRRLNNLPEEESDCDQPETDLDNEEELEDAIALESEESSDTNDFDLDRPLIERVQRFTTCADESSSTNNNLVEGKNGTKWHNYVPGENSTSGRQARQNIMRISPGPTSYATSRIIRDSPLSVWRLLINESMLRHIRRCTNAEASRQRGGTEDWSVTLEELETIFGLLYAKGLYLSPKTPVRLLWNSKWSPPIFAHAMSRDRFYEIMRYIRFDEKSTRSERLKQDKFTLASDLWTPFIENCVKCFNPFEDLTIDEQLMPCKCRCKYIQYMANKPDKFGLKFFLAVDLKTKYMCATVFPTWESLMNDQKTSHCRFMSSRNS